MAIAFYMDHNIPYAIAHGLRLRNVDVLTALEDKSHELSDSILLDRATLLKRVLFTSDDDFIVEGRRRQKERIEFAGIIYIRQSKISIGQCVKDLELIAKTDKYEVLKNTITFLPI